MNISIQEMERLGKEADKLHYQWAEKESWKKAHEAARKAYYESMAELGYPGLEKEIPGFEKAVAFLQTHVRSLGGLFGAHSRQEKEKPAGMGLSLNSGPRGLEGQAP